MGRRNKRWSLGFCSGPLLFTAYLDYLFYLSECTEVYNIAADNTFYACNKELRSVNNSLIDGLLAVEWFEDNHLNLNQEKYQLLFTVYKYENLWVKIGQTEILERAKQKLLCRNKLKLKLWYHRYVRKLQKKLY